MKRKQIHPVWIGLLLTAFLVTLSGCSGGGSSASATTPTTSPAATATYEVIGTISGLLGTGLVLQNNGTDNLAISENGRFKFSTRMEDGSSCNVTVLSQPTSPSQTCRVVHGSSTVNGSAINDVQVECFTTIVETFDNTELNTTGFWHTGGEFDRKIVAGELQYRLAGVDEFAYDYLPFMNEECGTISVDVAIAEPVYTGTGDEVYRTRLQGCGYHTATDGEAPGNGTGDVIPVIIWSGTQAYFSVYRCKNDECNTPETVEHLTPNGSGGVLLGEAAPNSTATLLIDWNNLAPGQFTFQMNNEVPQPFDPVAAGAPIDAAVPNKPEKYLGLQLASAVPAEMLAIVDNVSDGALVDNFDGKYLDGSFWKKTDGSRRLEGGRLVMETAQEFVGDPIADTRFNNTTLISQKYLIPTAEIVEADITIDEAAFVVDTGGYPAEVHAVVEMRFRPPAAANNDYTNSFMVQAVLKEGSPGITAEINATGCADYSCTTQYAIVIDNPVFATPVAKNNTYRMRIEHLGNGAIDITLTPVNSSAGSETLSMDLSSIAGFASTDFAGIALRTRSRGTDTEGEEAFARAFFDNVQVGGP